MSIMNEVWEFLPNNTGRTISNSFMYGQDIEEFKWRRKDLYCIEYDFSRKLSLHYHDY